MPDLQDGETCEMQGSGAKPYVLKNTGGVYSCTCPAWRNQSIAIERRSCKHLRKLRGDAAEEARTGGALPQRPARAGSDDSEEAGPPLLLAESWDNATDLSDWWMSEKLDGVRAYWDGKQFLSRQGNLYHAPDWFVDGLPSVPLDGELWIDRKKFQRTVSIVRRQDKSDLWKEVRFLVFDVPAATGGFEDRIGFLKDLFAKGELNFARAHAQERCRGLDALRTELARVESLGGEGLMLRQPGSKYVAGRSSTLLKIKTFHDAEAIVTGHQAGAGRHAGRLGALLVRLPSGKDFAIGTGFSDRERGNPPAIGATVTFRYQELSEAGIPRFPSYVGVRMDAPVRNEVAVSTAATPSPKPATSISTEKASGPPRHFEFTEGTSNKFWEVSISGNAMTTRWGRIGSNGQSKTKAFASPEAAANAMALLIEEKTDAGYVERSQ
ncbi:MAG TPA: DNA ligase [Verrucomicrobiae bacterium]|nr:DNA ligase [Verrucomicrobiae bacterium]